ncbi:hypothetical protein OHB37_18420 [Streptomyces albidoflavus]|uniref:hypothetical protein n=1 Tax=Streptomyces TaxID=1883 RepID=UPI00203704F2|nr:MULTISPECIES: hypothetical protein [unclassified Streptomyces]WSB16024.1 hypothetical protein OHB37_18420 [Streptomyces albidoflavus]WSD41590.1 hypothetical protein OG919_18415 [Streptomyces albidoflavus]
MPYVAWYPAARQQVFVVSRLRGVAMVRRIHQDAHFQVSADELQRYPKTSDPLAPSDTIAVFVETPKDVRQRDWVAVAGDTRRVEAKAPYSAGSTVLTLEGYGKWVFAAPRIVYRRREDEVPESIQRHLEWKAEQIVAQYRSGFSLGRLSEIYEVPVAHLKLRLPEWLSTYGGRE